MFHVILLTLNKFLLTEIKITLYIEEKSSCCIFMYSIVEGDILQIMPCNQCNVFP